MNSMDERFERQNPESLFEAFDIRLARGARPDTITEKIARGKYVPFFITDLGIKIGDSSHDEIKRAEKLTSSHILARGDIGPKGDVIFTTDLSIISQEMGFAISPAESDKIKLAISQKIFKFIDSF